MDGLLLWTVQEEVRRSSEVGMGIAEVGMRPQKDTHTKKQPRILKLRGCFFVYIRGKTSPPTHVH